MFAIEERSAVRDRLLGMANADERVVGAALVGSLSVGAGDRWSDLDLTFAVSDGAEVDQVITDWTRQIVADLDAVVLFDLPSGHTIYRVFLLPQCLQIDLSFTPAAWFRPRGPRFRLLFGAAGEVSSPEPPDPRDLFGWAVVYARAARAYIARRRWWQAAHCIDGVRDRTLALACIRRNLESSHGRGYDDLPPTVLDPLRRTLVPSLAPEALLEALKASVEALLRESTELGQVAIKAGQGLREWVT
ncbi:MAG TPA: nucleotidyltransferase domain-containing protein [Actinomycetota bacterium]